MPKKKILQAHDAFVGTEHIQYAQGELIENGPMTVLKQLHDREPELAAFISAFARDIAAGAMLDGNLPRAPAQELRLRIVALATSVYGAYNLAFHAHYKNMTKGTPVAVLDDEPEPTPPAPPTSEEGGTCGIT